MRIPLPHRWSLAVGFVSLAAGAMLATGVGAGVVSAAATPTTTPPAGTATTQPVVDDMRTLTIEVPAAWTQISTTPGTGTDGSSYPQIVASSDIARFQTSFDTSGVIYAAQQLNPDTEAGLAASFNFASQCTDGGTQPYQDAYFTGTMQTWTACGGTQARVVTLFANPLDQRFSVVLLAGVATPADDGALDLLLASFFVTKPQGAGGGTATATTVAPIPGVATTLPAVPAASTMPAVPVVATAPVGGGSGQGVMLQDSTGTITVAVPSTWTQSNVQPANDAQGGQVPAISAAPDLTAFQNGTGQGMFMVAAPYTTDLQTALTQFGPRQCQGGQVTPYSDDVFAGVMQTFSNCGGLDVTVLAANANGRTDHTIQIIAATTPGDTGPLQTIAASFNFVSAG